MNFIADGSITSPKGYKAAGVHCGLKKENRDLAAVVSDSAAAVAGVYTRNLVKGHSLVLTMERINKYKSARAIVINSGNANACVGPDGVKAAEEITASFAEHIGVKPEEVLIGSTGVIGSPMPIKKLQYGISKAIPTLSYDGGSFAAEAIMTTDTIRKQCAVRIDIGDKSVVIGGMAKGSGMIHPNMATMISIITTDAAISQELLQRALSDVVKTTYNRVTVDGDTSVDDMCLVFANGMAENDIISDGDSEAYNAFRNALHDVAEYLSRLLAKDGEGATKLLEIRIHGARTADDAYKAASAIAHSPLCKTMFFGEDANCGRIITAAGYSGAEFDPNKVDIMLGDLCVYSGGVALAFDEEAAKHILEKKEVLVEVNFNEGEYEDRVWTCDLSYDYVRINGSYRS